MDEPIRIPTIWEDQPVTGQDAAVVRAPEGMIDVARGLFQIDEDDAVRYLTSLSYIMAGDNGQVLHHADWFLASNVEEVAAYGASFKSHCQQCNATIGRALQDIVSGGRHIFLGMLYYAGPDHGFQTLSG